VGWASTRKLVETGIDTAYKLKYSDINWIRKKMNVNGARTVMELRGISCLRLSTVRGHAKSIASTRSFGKPVDNLTELEESVTLYASRAAEKLRKEKCTTSIINVFIKTNKHKKHLPQYYNSISITVDPTFHTPTIVKNALIALRRIYRKGFLYKKAGVMLFGMEKNDQLRQNLFEEDQSQILQKQKQEMLSIDTVNKKWGGNSIFLASRGVKQLWAMRSFNKSPRYNTSWLELPEITIK
jgi:DNA polymerase V